MTFKLDDMPPVTEFWELPIYDQGGYLIGAICTQPTANLSFISRTKSWLMPTNSGTGSPPLKAASASLFDSTARRAN
jgi:hypothetical protein